MGLDMYFYAEKPNFKAFIAFAGDSEENENFNYPDNLKNFESYIERRNYKSQTITESYQIGYFRKFNALHNYIVNNFADGRDECQSIYLTYENIKDMRDICEAILADHSKAEELLPTQSGFFFGSTEYDEWYFDDVKEAVKLFNLILDSLENLKHWRIVYRASW